MRLLVINEHPKSVAYNRHGATLKCPHTFTTGMAFEKFKHFESGFFGIFGSSRDEVGRG